MVGQPEPDDRQRPEEPEFPYSPPGLLARATYSLLQDAGASSSVRVRGLRHMAVGFISLVAWIGVVSVLGFLFIPSSSKPAAVAAAQPAAAPAPAPQRDARPPGFGWLLLLVFFPAVWSLVKMQIGLFQAASGVRFVDFYNWVEHSPLWRQFLLVPVIIVVVVPLVVGSLVGTLGLCGYVFRLVTRS
jgi:hypothetical protein